MADITVKELAKLVGSTPEHLLQQLTEAGIDIANVDQPINDQQKQILLTHFKKGTSVATAEGDSSKPKTITLKRKTTSTLKTGAGAKGRTVNVEVRKKKTYVERITSLAEERVAEEKAAAERAAAEAEAKRLRELAAQAEREAKQKVKDEAPIINEVIVAETVAPVAPAASVKAAPTVARPNTLSIGSQDEKRDKKAKGKDKKDVVKPLERHERRGGKNRLSMLDEANSDNWRGGSKRKGAKSSIDHAFEVPTAPVVREVVIPETITVADLAQKMSLKGADVVKQMIKMGAMVTINQVIDQDTAILVVEELGHIPRAVHENALEQQVLRDSENLGDVVARPPVVTIMGHVDHGKTSLLDYIRRTKVAAGEAGGITQHIGAYHVDTDKGTITFLDTPGHAAFTAMRARGAQCTDIVVLIVAADDGVKPQTIEAIQHAKAAKVPIVVAVNKMDKPDIDLDRIKNELSQYEIIGEDWGGDTMFAYISAKSGMGIDGLLDAILLQAEVLELKAVATGPARGVVVESRLDKGRGPVATVLVQEGCLKHGDILLVGMEYGSVRTLISDTGKAIHSAGPSIPVEVLGLSATVNAGDTAIVVQSERKAREVALFRQGKFREIKIARQQSAKLDNLFQQVKSAQKATLNIVLKADVQGSAEALVESLVKLTTDEVKVNIVASAVGAITESDVNLAIASQAIIIGFNVRANATARRLVDVEKVDLHYYSVIYNALDEVKRALTGMLKPEFTENIVGLAEVRDVFRSSKFGTIAGCMVIEGTVKRNNPIRVLRDSVVIFEGQLESLKRFKDDASEVRNGMECGIGVKNYNDVQAGDQIEVYERVQVQRTL